MNEGGLKFTNNNTSNSSNSRYTTNEYNNDTNNDTNNDNNNNINTNNSNNDVNINYSILNPYITKLNLLYYKNYAQGGFYFSFLGMNTFKLISGLMIININDLLDDELLTDLFFNDKYKEYARFKARLDMCNAYIIKSINYVKYLQLKIIGLNSLFYIDLCNCVNELIHKNVINISVSHDSIKDKLDIFINNLNTYFEFAYLYNVVVLLEHNNYILKYDGLYTFIYDYINSNELFIHSSIKDNLYILGRENPSLYNIKMIISQNVKFIDIDILNNITNYVLNMPTLPNMPSLNIKLLHQLLTQYNYNDLIHATSNDTNTIEDNTNKKDEHNTKDTLGHNTKDTLGHNTKDTVENNKMLYPKLIPRYIKRILDHKENIVKAINESEVIYNNIHKTLEAIMNYDKVNNWIITLNTDPVFDSHINNSFCSILENLYKNNNSTVDCSKIFNKSQINNTSASKYNINIHDSDNNIGDDNKSENITLLGITYDILPLNTILNGNNNIFNNTLSNISSKQNKIISNTIASTQNTKVIVHKIYIYKKLQPSHILSIIKKRISILNLKTQEQNIKNIIVLIDLYNNPQVTKTIQTQLNIDNKYMYGSIFINCKIDLYLRKMLAFLSYQNSFIKLGISTHNNIDLLLKKHKLMNDYNTYNNVIYTNFSIKYNKQLHNKKKTCCTCCKCYSRTSNYYLDYKYVPYLDTEIKQNIITTDNKYWIH
jgi:hypothetical protein